MIINLIQVISHMKIIWLYLLLLLVACTQVECDDTCLLDQRLCSQITSDTYKNTCYAESAIESSNQSLCDSITSIQTSDYCNFNFIKQQNSSSCEKLNTEYWTYNCYEYFAVNESSLCTKVRDQGLCWYNHAITLNDSTLCYKSDELERCIYKIALNTQDLNLCKSINSYNSYACQIKVAESTNDSKICEELIKPWNDYCFEKIA